MKFFVDTADLKEIREAHDMGVLDGGTTNLSLAGAEGNVDVHSWGGVSPRGSPPRCSDRPGREKRVIAAAIDHHVLRLNF